MTLAALDWNRQRIKPCDGAAVRVVAAERLRRLGEAGEGGRGPPTPSAATPLRSVDHRLARG
ncbi:hypothetical protein HUO13_01920 [Saccharopolyspora erythraea]|uniref:hypothetical protein n=1 Tax=Saccharopolyspora erythraea TaxID=1836 RepID=UPI001BA58DE9|nr:hypothetical protein [Saccharopolyspora erythraea]QUG99721.1 hypothetical protein HUO13_01920 [Saccharopolyspora erythraea]